jgi:chemotaxis family two-component system sensor kinase Cph1
MTTVRPVVTENDEDTRLAECAREPIHLPGAIQPHGALLVIDPDSLEILQATVNTTEVFGTAPGQLLATGMSALVGVDFQTTLRDRLATASGPNPLAVQVRGRNFDVIVHRTGDVGVVEFEPAAADPGGRDYLPALHAAIARLAGTTDSAALRTAAARELRQLTGFDQVMVYHFHPDEHGEVVADDHAAGMASYLGLHFPASDIPAQARRLYVLKGSGLIACTDYQPAALLPVNNPRTDAPIDLSRAELRSVSPYHLQFMRNMGQGASFTMSLVSDGHLLGLITCAHRRPRRIPFLLRRACEILAQQVALQLEANARSAVLTRRLETQGVRNLLVEQMNAGLDVATGLTDQALTILDLVQAEGATLCLHHRLVSIGHTPGYPQIMALLAALTTTHAGISPLLTDALALDRPELAELLPSIGGVFVLPFGNAGDCLIWFRPELLQTIHWLGAQTAENRPTPLSPRTSFDSWRQTVSHRSAPWADADITEAAELGRDIDQVLLRLAEAQMAHMALHDALTGLPNRRLLVERISSALDRADRHGGEVPILFCDLDDFKRVNDTAGHAAGDAVLVEAAARLSSVLRAGDSVARVGGDEFVIVLEPFGDGDLTLPAAPERREPATEIAQRVKTELSRPIRYQDHEHVISVSVGITFAAAGDLAEDALRDADVAMYRAKQTGKNRVSTFDDSLRAGIFERATAEQALHAALDHDGLDHPRLTVAYQPVIDLDSGLLIGFEALPRLTDSAGEAIDHDVFSYVAEHSALIGPLGATVLDTALAALARWRSEHPGDHPAKIAVNLSARQAQQADMPALVRATLDRYELNCSDLALELTESVLIEAGSSTLRQLSHLRESGVGIAINDFGAGNASLSQLAILPIDAIKLDRTFVQGLPDDTVNRKIVHAIAGLAVDLGLRCIFTGIDEPEQLTGLPRGVLAQGIVLGRSATTPRDDRPRGQPATPDA